MEIDLVATQVLRGLYQNWVSAGNFGAMFYGFWILYCRSLAKLKSESDAPVPKSFAPTVDMVEFGDTWHRGEISGQC